MKLGLTALRAVVGAVFFAHGTQKLFGWFGGPGLDNMAEGFDSMGLRPGRRNALIAAALAAGLAGPRLVQRLAAPASPPPAAAPAPQTDGRPEAARETVGSSS